MTDVFIRERPEISGRIYMRHLRSVGMCGPGTRRILLDYFDLSQKEVSDFFKNGMEINDFKNRFGHDAMAQQAIEFWEKQQDGQK